MIGAGISGLICARRLRDVGMDVRVFEKSRGVGGRMATRRTEDGLRFDHGAQYFTVRDRLFERYVQQWASEGIVAPWNGRIVDLTCGRADPKDKETLRFVGVPGMNAICKDLASGLDIRFQTQVAPPARERGMWHLQSVQEESLGQFDCLVTCAPAIQSSELLVAAPELQRQAGAIAISACWAAMIAFTQPLRLSFDGAFVHASPLSWIARNDSKPRRGDGIECWVLHAAPDWSDEHLEQTAEDVLPQMLDAVWEAIGVAPRSPSYATAHRWRYAIPQEPLPDRCLFDSRLLVGACGDWCNGPRVEGAFLSGMALADRIISDTGIVG